MTALLATSDSDHVEVFCQFLKHCACVVTAIKICSELLKVAAKKSHLDVAEIWR